MTYNDLIEAVSAATGIPEDHVKTVLATTQKIITDTCAEGGVVRYTHLGTFSCRVCPEHHGRNLRTGEPYLISARRIPKFTPSQTFKAKLLDD